MRYAGTLACSAVALALSQGAHAQNTGGVFPPVVNEDHKSVQYRATLNPDTDGFAQRIHYQQSINDDVMFRGLVQARKTDESDVDFDFFQAEMFWELSDDDDIWKTGLRFDARIRDEGRPGLFGAHWMNQRKFGDHWQGRFIVLTATDVGDDARDGVFLQTRSQITYSGAQRFGLGMEFYNSYGALDDIADFEDQTHQIGPIVTFSPATGWGIYTNALFGLTDASPDNELRIWLTRGF